MTKPITRIAYGGLLLLSLLLFSLTPGVTSAQFPSAIRLYAPALIKVVYAQEAQTAPAEAAGIRALVDQAGISAYFDRGSAIDLSLVRGLYRTIESDTSEYLIGSVQVKTNTYSYPEAEDVHLYVSTSGWVMAYYLNADPVAKIFDAAQFGGGSINTKLEIVLSRAATALGMGSGFTPTFYDFRYPNATHLLLVGEKTDQTTDAFQANLPATFTFFERSWAFWTNHDTVNTICSYVLNDVTITKANKTGEGKYGVFTANQVAAGQIHQFAMVDTLQSTFTNRYSTGGLALIYRETP